MGGEKNRPRLEPRILIEDAENSYHAAARVGNADIFDNILIYGDNLLALKALEADFTGKVKCVFIDPPYNTGSAFAHYDDGIEHSIWLGLMRDRLEIVKRLLSEDGSIWITIDDNEAHYLKVLCDEVFGRSNFFGSIVWQHSVQGKNDAKTVSLHHNYVIAYTRSELFRTNTLPRTEKHNINYSNPDSDPKGAWRSGDVRSPNHRENLKYDVVTPSGKTIAPPEKGWRWAKETFQEKIGSGEITFIDGGTRVLRKIYLADQGGRVPESIWFGDEVGTTREATSELREVLGGMTELFPTPKPERLVQRVLLIATKPGDLVLDSFAGSGTTGAAAHKMGRRWIMVELGEHYYTHIVPRLQKVVDGKDRGGITEATGWNGGGGFRCYKLAPSLLQKGKWGRQVVSKEYNAEMLMQAVCKLEGFTYAPSPDIYWQHGRSSESDFIYVTTQMLGSDELAVLGEEVGDARSLLVLCSAFRGNQENWPNLTVRKVPSHICARFEWGRDDYSLNVANLPIAEAKAAPPKARSDSSDDAENE